MAPPRETPNLDWNHRLIAPAPGVDPASTERDDGDTEPADTTPDEATRTRLVPRARCRGCSEHSTEYGLCIECFFE